MQSFAFTPSGGWVIVTNGGLFARNIPAQGFPIIYSVDGKQYIAVMAGLGGGSPRNAPGSKAGR